MRCMTFFSSLPHGLLSIHLPHSVHSSQLAAFVSSAAVPCVLYSLLSPILSSSPPLFHSSPAFISFFYSSSPLTLLSLSSSPPFSFSVFVFLSLFLRFLFPSPPPSLSRPFSVSSLLFAHFTNFPLSSVLVPSFPLLFIALWIYFFHFFFI